MDLEIEELRRELSQWRESHTSHKRIPEGIWSRAAAAAQKFGVTPTSKALKLDNLANTLIVTGSEPGAGDARRVLSGAA